MREGRPGRDVGAACPLSGGLPDDRAPASGRKPTVGERWNGELLGQLRGQIRADDTLTFPLSLTQRWRREGPAGLFTFPRRVS